MKLKGISDWRTAFLIIAVVGMANVLFAWLLFNTHLGRNFPDVLKTYSPVFAFIVTVWYLLAKRPTSLKDLVTK